MSELMIEEISKSFLLAFCAGFFGGILSHAVVDYFARTRGIQKESVKDRITQYASAGLVYGTMAFLIVWATLQSYSFESMIFFKKVNQFSVFIAILYPPAFAVTLEWINTIFKKDYSDRT